MTSTDLTDKEIQVAKLIGRGKTNEEIAKELELSVISIKVRASTIYTKLGLRNRAECAVWADRQYGSVERCEDTLDMLEG